MDILAFYDYLPDKGTGEAEPVPQQHLMNRYYSLCNDKQRMVDQFNERANAADVVRTATTRKEILKPEESKRASATKQNADSLKKLKALTPIHLPMMVVNRVHQGSKMASLIFSSNFCQL